MNVLPEVARERIERAISVARILGGVLSLAVGPFLPNVGLAYVVLFGAMLIAYGVVALRFDENSGSLKDQLRFANIVTFADGSFASLALLIYSPDPAWAVGPSVLPLIIVAALRSSALRSTPPAISGERRFAPWHTGMRSHPPHWGC